MIKITSKSNNDTIYTYDEKLKQIYIYKRNNDKPFSIFIDEKIISESEYHTLLLQEHNITVLEYPINLTQRIDELW